jgi:GntR family transcriptional regulator, transcriptional repressor for pyruvate dehydrogenase complex
VARNPGRTIDPLAFETIHRGRVYEQVLRQIQEQIASGRLKPGDKLPPERVLAQRFQVSRSSIRDAIQALQTLRLVRSRQGGATAVCEISADSLVSPLSRALKQQGLVAELMEARKMIEPLLAARAATNATDQDVARLEDVLRRQAEKMRRGEPIIEEDSEFHYAIAVAARNGVVQRMVDMLMDLLRENRIRGMQGPGRPQRSLAGHRRVVDAIRRRDARAAQAAMLRHIREIEQILMRAAPQP